MSGEDGVEVEKANQENQGETRRVDKLNPIPWQPFYATRARGLLKDAARDHTASAGESLAPNECLPDG